MEDEIISINAIYGENTLTLQNASAVSNTCILKIPSVDVTLLLHFPSTYPSEAFEIVRSEHVGHELRKGAGTDVIGAAQEILAASFIKDEPFVFELIEQLSSRIPELNLYSNTQLEEVSTENIIKNGATAQIPIEEDRFTNIDPSWTLSDVVTEKKSVFVARAATVSDPAIAKQYVAHLVSTDKKAAKATHNITAWRIRRGTATFQDCDDDGETAAGGRLLHLLQIMDVWDVVVVVSRWYGGVQLGPDRFRIISSTAREAVVRLGGR